MPGAEAFTVLALVEAKDRASEIFRRIDEGADKLAATLGRTAGAAGAAGKTIDESLLQTASGADAMSLASARVEAASAQVAAAATAQADAERALLDAQAQAAAAADGDAAAMTRLTEASDALAAAQKRTADAAKMLRDAEATQAATAEAAAAKADLTAGATTKLAGKTDAAGGAFGKFSSAALKGGLGLALVGGVAVKAAGNFQELMTRTVTSAGASASSLQQMSSAVLQMAVQTGTSSSELAKGLYMVNSAGYQGAAGLNVLRASAEGARAEGADLATVSNAVTTALNAYHLPASAAVSVTDQLVAVVSHGKTTMEALSGAIAQVLPVAASAKLSLSQVGGAMATMTGQGMSADQAAQDLKNTINALQNPNQTAINEMQQMGLSANDVAQHLGTRGLTGTIDMLTQAITSHMGPSGMVLMNAFNESKQAAQDANTMISNLPKTLQNTAKAFLDGTISSKTWRKDLQGLSPVQQHLMQQFATTAKKTHSFNDVLARGGPAAQTYNAALAKMTGGTTGLTTALMLSGKHAGTFKDNAKGVGEAAQHAGKHVDGWSEIQHTFNFKMAAAKQSVESAGIAIGTILLPFVTQIAGAVTAVLTPVLSWINHNQTLVGLIFTVTGAILAVIGAIKIATTVMGLFNLVMDANPISLIIIAIAALVAGFVYLWTHVKGFRDFWKTAWKDITDVVSAVVDWVKGHWPLLLAIITGPIGIAVLLVNKYWKNIVGFFHAGVNTALSIVHWFERIPGWVRGWLDEAAAWVGHGIDQIVNWFAGLPGRVWTWLSQLYNDAISAGKNFMIGLYNGLVSMAGWLYGQVMGLVKSVIPGPILKALGIGSPSRWAHWAGQMVGAGLANGILASHNAVAQASQSLARAVTGTAAGTLSAGLTVTGTMTGTPGLIGAAASGGGGPTIVIDVHHNHVMNDRDMDPLVDKIGRAVATRILPAGGRRIQM